MSRTRTRTAPPLRQGLAVLARGLAVFPNTAKTANKTAKGWRSGEGEVVGIVGNTANTATCRREVAP